jgi:shikimate dehydrogenase
MAVNKELLERYKAMKAAKLAQAEQSNQPPKTGFAALSQTQYSSAPTPAPTSAPEQNQSSWQTTYAQNTYSQEVRDNYNSQFSAPQSFMTPAPMPESTDIYASPTPAPTSAPVHYQPPVEEQTFKKFALIGYPLDYSMSEYIHLAGFKSMGINATYEILPTAPEELSDRIKYLRSNGYSGFNITIPLKIPSILFLDEIDPSANIVDAINTVVIDPQTNVLKGYNTDAAGFINAIPKDFPLYNKTVAVMGTGGAARAAITALAQKQVKEIRLYTRNIANCIELVDYLRKTFPQITFNAYQIDQFKDFSDVNLLVNATPIGMSGPAVGFTPAEEDELRTLPNDALIYDVVYNPKKTNLVKLAQKLNLRCINGVDMLVWQAYEAEKIWTGRTPDFKDMKIALLENL